jgi:hypothetical protein
LEGDVRIHTPVRRQAPTEEVELRDLLDRILDKGLFLGSANMLLLGETDLAGRGQQFSVSSMQMNPGPRDPEKPSRAGPRRPK